ncbi:DUF6308 family protein [Arthrobacter sp. H14-L1]|uniref:DUF6308 family protein n=1 Tax=Arthrobacter sp. H14-L1 TaxID=2996697 RepID=UPI003B6429CE
MLVRCEDPALAADLASASDETDKAIVRLFGVLESTPAKCVRLTTLSKVLHRVRPALLPLFDDNIKHCYSGVSGATVP